VRSLRAGRLFTWWFLNFNEHATHHRDVSVPWHRLPAERRPLPPAYAANQEVDTVPGAIRNLLRGPRIVVKP
jgi:fatty acid desaturase